MIATFALSLILLYSIVGFVAQWVLADSVSIDHLVMAILAAFGLLALKDKP